MKLKNLIKKPENLTLKLGKSKGVHPCGFCQEELEVFDIFGPKFNDREVLTNKYICKDCAVLFADYFRKKSFYISKKETKLLQQNEILDCLKKVEFPCILSFTESYKKHRLFKSQINFTKTNFAIQCDNYRVYLNLDEDVGLLNFLEEIYNKYELNKEWLETGEIPSFKILEMKTDYIKYKNLTDKIKKTNKLHILVKFINDKINRNKK
jgi:hypothetical protein